MDNKIKDISVDLIDDPEAPMRTKMDEDNLNELASSIKKLGLIQPITIRKVKNRYEVVAGHRRLRAAQIASLPTIRAVIADLDEAKADDIKIHENLFREDVNPVDEARFICGLIDKYGYTPTELSKKVNKSIAYLKTRYELLEYPDYLIFAVEEGKIGLGAAAWLARITNDRVLRDYTRFAMLGGITVRRAEAWYMSWQAGQLPGDPEQYQEPEHVGRADEVKLHMTCALCGCEDDLDNLDILYAHPACARAYKEMSVGAANAAPDEPPALGKDNGTSERSEE